MSLYNIGVNRKAKQERELNQYYALINHKSSTTNNRIYNSILERLVGE